VDLVAALLRVCKGRFEHSSPPLHGHEGSSGAGGCAFEAVEVLEDCYGVRRFVRAWRASKA
jgi:hypothetical protein